MSVYQRITENNDIITVFWTDSLLEMILRKDNLDKAEDCSGCTYAKKFLIFWRAYTGLCYG